MEFHFQMRFHKAFYQIRGPITLAAFSPACSWVTLPLTPLPPEAAGLRASPPLQEQIKGLPSGPPITRRGHQAAAPVSQRPPRKSMVLKTLLPHHTHTLIWLPLRKRKGLTLQALFQRRELLHTFSIRWRGRRGCYPAIPQRSHAGGFLPTSPTPAPYIFR